MNESTPTPTAPAPPSTPTPAPSPPAALTAPGTALEIAQMLAAKTIDTAGAGRLAKAGNISTLSVAQALSTLRAAAEPQAPDGRSPEVRELDAAFPPAAERDYTIRYYTPGQEPPVMPKEVQAFDANARGWMAGAEFPRDHGNALVSAVSKVIERTHVMTADQIDQYGGDEYVKLQRVYGEDLEEKLSAAGHMIQELEKTRPGLKQFLNTRGVGDSATVAALLIQQAERWHARRKGR
jgi:hypothetical protein